MRKIINLTLPLLCLCLSLLSLTACQKENNTENTAVSTSTAAARTDESAHEEETEPNTKESAPEAEEISETEEQKGLPEGVVLSGIDFTVTDEEPDEVTYGSSGIWQIAGFEDFVYASEPGEAELKKYHTGDTLIGLSIKSAGFSFLNMYEDNEYHEGGCRVNSYVDLEGTLTLTGTLWVENEDSELIFKKGNIMFIPDEDNIFPRLGGLFEGEEKFYYVFCGNTEDEELCEEIKGLAAGDNVRAEITVSDINITAAMGGPISGFINCKIDSAELL